MPQYLVIGLYADNLQRFAQDIEATTADEAEHLMQEELSDELMVAAVMEIHPEDLDRQELGEPARMKLVQ